MIIPKLRIKGKTTICYRPYPLPDPIRSIDDFWRLNCLDLDDMTEFELWQERERVKAALVNVDPESPVWIPVGSDCISAADWLQLRLRRIDEVIARRQEVSA